MNIISCSRRTDIPSWYSKQLLDSLEAGKISLAGPAGERSISLTPDTVHSLVFWSKNYSKLLSNKRLVKLLRGYNVYFHFTITGLSGTLWEPGSPPVNEAVAQAREIALTWGPERLSWRFDPIVFWRQPGGPASNLYDFTRLADSMVSLGVGTCTFSFVDWYPKVVRRIGDRFSLVRLSEEEKLAYVGWLSKAARDINVALGWCASGGRRLPSGLSFGRCIDADLLSRLRPDGPALPHHKDQGQRPHCRCSRSIDIGSYLSRCYSACLYCYANPSGKQKAQNG